MLTKKSILKQLLDTDVFENNKYLDLYAELIVKNAETKKIKLYTQRHHIIPKHVEKICNKDVARDTVFLSYCDHMLAHYYLCLCSKSPYIFAANFKAIKWILQNPESRRIDNKDYKKSLKDKLEIFKSSLPFYEELRIKANKIICEQSRNRVRLYDETGKKTSVDRKNVDKYIQAGWIQGIPPTEAAERGLARRGIKLSETTRKKMSAAHLGKTSGMKGKKHSQKTLDLLSKKHKGKNNGFFGKHHCIETKHKLSEIKKSYVEEKIQLSVIADFNKGYSINKLREIYKMSARKILRILLDNNIIDIELFRSKYKV